MYSYTGSLAPSNSRTHATQTKGIKYLVLFLHNKLDGCVQSPPPWTMNYIGHNSFFIPEQQRHAPTTLNITLLYHTLVDI